MEIKVGSRLVGNIVDGVYVTVRKKEHFMRKYAGYGISEQVLDILEQKGVKRVRIIYEGVKGTLVFETTVEQFRKTPNTHVFQGDRQKFVPQYLMEQVIE